MPTSKQTPLARKLRALIEAEGPITVFEYFSKCLSDPEYGYYMTRDPFGLVGDFVTAPEISQLFGEMIAVALVGAWQGHGAPSNVQLIELGPGRGTMMADILRVIKKVAPKLYNGLSVQLVETSAKLRAHQEATIEDHIDKLHWLDTVEDLPEGFSLIVANEFFDAIPIRQFVKTQAGFRERVVALDYAQQLTFSTNNTPLNPNMLPEPKENVPDGTIFEMSPERLTIMETLCQHLRKNGGTAFIIDYGHLSSGFGDTLQAVLEHDFDPPLAHPGIADLTSHVDFEELGKLARLLGLYINGLIRQGDFLTGLGLLQRAGTLGSGKDQATQEEITDAVKRLAAPGPGFMGELFKVLTVSSRAIKLAPFPAPRTFN